MKKIISIMLVLTFLLVFTACPNEDSANGDKEKISLTKDNYKQYLSITVSIEDYQTRLEPTGTTLNKYISTATVKVTASRKKDCKFEDVEIKFTLSVLPYSTGIGAAKILKISYDGDGSISVQIEDSNLYRYSKPPSATENTFRASSISGTVII